MKIRQSYIAIGSICGLILLGHLYTALSRAKLPTLDHTYYFESCPVSVEIPAPPILEETYGLEKILSPAEGYLYRVSCISLDAKQHGNISLIPIDLLDMFSAEEITEIIDTNFEISGFASGPLFYYEFLGVRDEQPIKSFGAFYFNSSYLLNVELITFDQDQDNIDATEYLNTVRSHSNLLKKRPSYSQSLGQAI